MRLIGRTGKTIFDAWIGFSHPRKRAQFQKHYTYKPKTWRANENHDIIPNAASLVREAWENLKGRVKSRKPFRSVYAARWNKLNLSYSALDKIVTIGGMSIFPRHFEMLTKIAIFSTSSIKPNGNKGIVTI